MKAGPRIDYKTLRKVSPETARLAVLEYLKTSGTLNWDANRSEAFRTSRGARSSTTRLSRNM